MGEEAPTPSTKGTFRRENPSAGMEVFGVDSKGGFGMSPINSKLETLMLI